MVDLYTKFVSSFLFPCHEKLKAHSTVAVEKAMEESQWWSSDKLKEYQNIRLNGFLQEAGNNVPYYKELFANINFQCGHQEGVKALQQLPFLTKNIIRNNTDLLFSDKAKKTAKFNTGGSSGEPLVFYIGKDRVSHDVAAKWRATRWWGVDIGDPEIVVWGSPIELNGQDYIKKLRDKLFRTSLIPAFEMSEAKLDEFVSIIIRQKPRMLFGYPSSLALIAKHAEKTDKKLSKLGIKVAFVTSERVYDHQRKIIEEIFGCPVANGYGGRDSGFIAHQCPQNGMHITAEDIIVEIVDSDGEILPPGESGEVVVTHLATKDFPFIRYRTGDIAILDDNECACGRGLPLLREIQGRSTDFITAIDGTVMHGLALIYVLRELDGISNFKIIQQSINEIDVQIVQSDCYQENSDEIIRQGFKDRLGNDVVVKIEKVDEIIVSKSGKHCYVTSNISRQ